MNRKVFFTGLVLCSLLLQGCATTKVNVDIPAVPEEDEKKASQEEKMLGRVAFNFMSLNYKTVSDPKNYYRLKRIGTRIAHYTERSQIQYKYYILDSKFCNAFSLPDGYIFFSNAMIERLETDEKIAAVMAHEIAHVTHKHVVDSYERHKKKSMVRILGERIFNIATEIAYNHAYEFQADQTALRYLRRAGYDPKVMLDVLEDLKLIQEEEAEELKKDYANDPKTLKKMEKPIRTHPYNEDRLAKIHEYLDEILATEDVQYNPEDFNF